MARKVRYVRQSTVLVLVLAAMVGIAGGVPNLDGPARAFADVSHMPDVPGRSANGHTGQKMGLFPDDAADVLRTKLRAASAFIEISETINVSDVVRVLPTKEIEVTEVIAVSDSSLPWVDIQVIETVIVTDAPLPPTNITITETIATTDVFLSPVHISLTEVVGITDSSRAVQIGSPVVITITETIATTDVFLSPVHISLTEVVGVTDSFLSPVHINLTEVVEITDSSRTVQSGPPVVITIAETIKVGASPGLPPVPITIQLTENIGVSDPLFAVGSVHVEVAESVAVSDSPRSGVELSAVFLDSPDPVVVGDRLTYTIEIANKGFADATGITVTYHLPAQVRLGRVQPVVTKEAGSYECNVGLLGRSVACELGTLGSDDRAEVTILVVSSTEGRIDSTIVVLATKQAPDITVTQTTTVVPFSIVPIEPSPTATVEPARPRGPSCGFFPTSTNSRLTAIGNTLLLGAPIVGIFAWRRMRGIWSP